MEMLNTKRITRSSESGMTLIEVMVSTIVLGVVLVGLGQALTYGIKVNNESKLKVASLNVCKYLTENLKTQISQSQVTFDGTAASDTTYYVDAYGNKTYSGTGQNMKEDFTSESAFQAHVVISNSALTKTVGGVTSVLVKVLDVSIVDLQDRGRTGHEVRMRVEIIRPSA